MTNMIKIGDIYSIDLGGNKTSRIIMGKRPVIVVKAVLNSTLAHVVPLTASEDKLARKTHVIIKGYGLSKPSIALIEQLRLVDKAELGKFIGSLYGTKELDEIFSRLVRFFESDIA